MSDAFGPLSVRVQRMQVQFSVEEGTKLAYCVSVHAVI